MTLAPRQKLVNIYFSMRTIAISLLLITFITNAQSYSFRDEDIPDSLRNYIKNNTIPSGRYLVDIYLNDELKDSKEIDFYSDKNKKTAPCLTANYLLKIGVNIQEQKNNSCVNIESTEYAHYKFDFTSLKLKIYYPQAMLLKKDKQENINIDYGTPALFTNYRINSLFSKQKQQVQRNTSSYTLNTSSGINFNEWRYRINTYGMKSNNNSQFNINGNYLEKNIFKHKSKLIIGDNYTNSSSFNNTRLFGLQIYTDESMSDYNDTVYKPVISGLAQSPSRLVVRQGQYIVLSKDIPAGPFAYEIEGGIYNGSEFDVEITGDDGKVQRYTQQSNALNIMQAPGTYKYNFFLGKTTEEHTDENVIGGEIYYGFPFRMTGHAGIRFSDQRTSFASGLATDLGVFGGFGTNITAVKWKNGLTGTKHSFLYQKRIFDSTFLDTEYSFYHNYTDQPYTNNSYLIGSQNSWRVNLSHNFNKAGYLSLRAEGSEYNEKKSTNISAYHTLSLGKLNIRTAIQRNKFHGGKTDTIFNLELSTSLFSPMLNINYGLTNNGNNIKHNVGIYGQNDIGNNYINWQYQGNKSNHPGYSGSHYLSARLTNEHGIKSATYTKSDYSDQYTINAEGGILVHSSGVYIGKEISGSTALINTNGISGIRVNSNRGATNNSGYMLITNLRSFKKNDILLDASSIPDNVTIPNIKKTIYPDDNAITVLNFITRKGQDIIYTVYGPDGKFLPFGSVASYTYKGENLSSGIVDEDGTLYLSGLEKSGEVKIQYGLNLSCSFSVEEKDFTLTNSEITKACHL